MTSDTSWVDLKVDEMLLDWNNNQNFFFQIHYIFENKVLCQFECIVDNFESLLGKIGLKQWNKN